MREPSNINLTIADKSKQHFLQEEEEDYILFEAYADDIIIKDPKYQEVVDQLNHLDQNQKEQL